MIVGRAALSFQCVLVCVHADTCYDAVCFATTNANMYFVDPWCVRYVYNC